MICCLFRALGNHEDEGRLLAYDSEHTHLYNESGTVGLKNQVYIVEGAKLHFLGDLFGLSIYLHLDTCIYTCIVICTYSFSTTIKQIGAGRDGF